MVLSTMNTSSAMMTRTFGLGVDPTARYRAFALVGGLGGALSAGIAGAATLTILKSAESSQGFSGTTLLILFVIAPAAWGFYTVLPLFAMRGAARGAVWGRVLLTVVALFNVGVLFQPTTPTYWWLNLSCAALIAASSIMAWLLPRRPDLVTPRVPAPGTRRRTVARALLLFALVGLFGAHCVYLRRSWECVLYIALLGMAFIAAGTAFLPLPLAAVSVLLVADFLRIDTHVEAANDRLQV